MQKIRRRNLIRDAELLSDIHLIMVGTVYEMCIMKD